LGPDTLATSQFAPNTVGYQDNGSGSLLAWAGDDNRMIDASGEFLHAAKSKSL